MNQMAPIQASMENDQKSRSDDESGMEHLTRRQLKALHYFAGSLLLALFGPFCIFSAAVGLGAIKGRPGDAMHISAQERIETVLCGILIVPMLVFLFRVMARGYLHLLRDSQSVIRWLWAFAVLQLIRTPLVVRESDSERQMLLQGVLCAMWLALTIGIILAISVRRNGLRSRMEIARLQSQMTELAGQLTKQ